MQRRRRSSPQAHRTVYDRDRELVATIPDTHRPEIDQVLGVSPVPKCVAVTPDGRLLRVSNWCSYDLSVVDTASGTEVDRLDVGCSPRGIAVSPDATTAYVALMGGTRIVTLDLDDLTLGSIQVLEDR